MYLKPEKEKKKKKSFVSIYNESTAFILHFTLSTEVIKNWAEKFRIHKCFSR